MPANVLKRLKRKSITYGHPPQIIHSSVLYTGEYEAPSRYFKESAPSESGFLTNRQLYYVYNNFVKDAYRASPSIVRQDQPHLEPCRLHMLSADTRQVLRAIHLLQEHLLELRLVAVKSEELLAIRPSLRFFGLG